MDNLFEQMANISKAHAYDIVSKQVGQLKLILAEVSPLIDKLIEATPTGEERNKLCDLNIKIKSSI